MHDLIVMDGVREYGENYPVELKLEEPSEYNNLSESRLTIKSGNEGRHSYTSTDLIDILKWVKKNKPDLWEVINNESNLYIFKTRCYTA